VSLLAAAVANNADWCDSVCRAFGCDTARIDGLWVNRSPAPAFYPNAVTLDHVDTAVQFDGVRSMLEGPLPRPWAVKDSFGALDLAPLGFEVLLEAEWIGLSADHQVPEPRHGGTAWVPVRTDSDLVAWERAWRVSNMDASAASAPRLFQPILLRDHDIRFLAGIRAGRIVAGVIANRSDDGTGPVVGVSNIVLPGGDLETHGPGVLAAVRHAFPGLPLVGYERGDDLTAMLALGLRSLGSLRVWLTTR
jgi:hypothetical protein